MEENELFIIKNYKKDSIIYLEKSKALPYLFLIKSGKVVQSIFFPQNIENEILTEGDTFGFVSCLTGLNNIDRITALTDCSIITVKKSKVIDFLSQKRDIFLKIIKEYSNKLRELDSIYNKILKGKSVISNYDSILQAKKFFENNGMRKQAEYAEEKYKIYLNLNTYNPSLILTKEPESGTKLEIKKDEVIFCEGEYGKNFYYIEKGKVKISHLTENKEYIMSILNNGEFFGEMSILNQMTRMATAIAFEDSSILVLNQENFMDKLGNKILQKIFISLATRIYHTYRRVLNLCITNPVSRLYDCLDYLIDIEHGVKGNNNFNFYFSIDELKRMTDILEVNDKQIADFLNDDNIRFSMGEIVILNLERFYSRLRKFTGSEKNI